jgi:membrane protease YdiL (CAAX protease family)
MLRAAAATRLLAAFEVVVCSGVPTQLLVGSALVASGFAPSPTTSGPTLALVAPLLLIDTLLLVTLMVAFTHARGERVRDLWLGTRRPLREALLGLALAPTVFIGGALLLNAIRLVAPWLQTVPENPVEAIARQGGLDTALFALVAVIGGGVREELQRAFVLQRFERHLGGSVIGVLLWSAAFGAGHFEQGLDAVIATGLIGVFWGLMYLRRRSVVAPVISHAGFNLLQVLTMALLPRP